MCYVLQTRIMGGGIEIICHGQFYLVEDQLLPASLIEDIVEDRKRLEKVTNTIVNGMAYPNGTYSPCVFTALRAAGIKYCRRGCCGFNSLEVCLKRKC